MKRYLFQGVLLFAALVLAVPAWSYTIDAGGTNVGGVDTLVDATELANSGFATELAWVQFWVPGATLTVFDSSLYSFVLVDGQTDIYASLLQDSPDYFFLKTGAAPGTDDHFLFTNSAELNYAVIDFLAAGVDITNIGAISHVGETGGGTSVPEPGALLLLGTGLVGLVGFRRVRRTQ